MKRLLTLLILTGFVFGQDVLLHKSGELKKGVLIEKLDNDIVFQIEGESKYTRFSIDLVEIIETNNRAIFYPFDIPTKKEGNDLAPIALQFLFNPTPLQNCMGISCGIILFFIAIVYESYN